MRSIIIGMLAHVDSGKTTLSEAMLYQSGVLRQLGKVDRGNTVLDYDSQERERGITIYAKEAFFSWKDCEITLLDTPGHADLAAEMERTLPVMDAAVLIISATDGVQSHTLTIWQMLKHYQIPVFIFINKMDVAHQTQSVLLHEITGSLHAHGVDFTQPQAQRDEEIAMGSDALLEQYLETGSISEDATCLAIAEKNVIPCYFGSAQQVEGVATWLDGICRYTQAKTYSRTFSARVYKITHDHDHNRMTHLKLTGGSLSVKQVLEGEKIDEIRRYHGKNYVMVKELDAGHVCALKGISHLQAGDVLGAEAETALPVLSSALTYRMVLEDESDPLVWMKKIAVLADEDPSLHLHYDPKHNEIRLQLRGDIQAEVLQKRIEERFHLKVQFGEGSVAYRETICEISEGVGHYEPLRHYAEVHLKLEPLPRNSGIQVTVDPGLEHTAPSLQREIVSYLQAEEMIGVLSGSPLCDMKITLIAVKTHEKHTSGGDIREAVRRALRQGLKMNQSRLLEPYMCFSLRIGASLLSRAMYDLDQAQATYSIHQTTDGNSEISGRAPLRLLQNYAKEVSVYTKGSGVFHMRFDGYDTVHHLDRILHEIGYDDERDVENPSGSIFCIHGAGTYIAWDQVYDYMHIPLVIPRVEKSTYPKHVHRQIRIDDEEWKRVSQTLHQPRKKWKKQFEAVRVEAKESTPEKPKQIQTKQPCLIVDGYNMIFSWPNLSNMAKHSMDQARASLLAMLGSYQGYRRCLLIVVFDAYRTNQVKETIQKDHNIYVVYTKQTQTADTYIEKTTHTLANTYQIRVATSDAQEQNIILGAGASRVSASELYQEIQNVHRQEMKQQNLQPQFRHMALHDLRKWNADEDDETV